VDRNQEPLDFDGAGSLTIKKASQDDLSHGLVAPFIIEIERGFPA
jgi:hypothetical protein